MARAAAWLAALDARAEARLGVEHPNLLEAFERSAAVEPITERSVATTLRDAWGGGRGGYGRGARVAARNCEAPSRSEPLGLRACFVR